MPENIDGNTGSMASRIPPVRRVRPHDVNMHGSLSDLSPKMLCLADHGERDAAHSDLVAYITLKH